MSIHKTQKRGGGTRLQQGGFTLVESLVAITVLLVIVVVPMQIATHSIKSTALAKEQLTAVFLAQEGVETILRLRDNAELSGGATWSWIPAACTGGNVCSVNASDSSVVACASSVGCVVYLDADKSTNAYYTHTATGNSDSGYDRAVTITDPGGSREATITSVVSWFSSAVNDTLSITVKTQVFNQYE